MKVAVIGPRRSTDTEIVGDFCRELYRQNPAITLISGGAKGVDSMAEFTWHDLGGLVWSYRAKKVGEGDWAAEKWVYQKAGEHQRFVLQGYPTFTARSALIFRNMLMAEEADRVVAFLGPRSMGGAEWTAAYAKDVGRPVHVWRDGAWE